jgi:hypothetical protein
LVANSSQSQPNSTTNKRKGVDSDSGTPSETIGSPSLPPTYQGKVLVANSSQSQSYSVTGKNTSVESESGTQDVTVGSLTQPASLTQPSSLIQTQPSPLNGDGFSECTLK